MVVLAVLIWTAATKSGATKDSSKKEKKKEKAPPAEKKEKKKEPEKEPEELDAAEEALAAEPKSKDPFDELPKG